MLSSSLCACLHGLLRGIKPPYAIDQSVLPSVYSTHNFSTTQYIKVQSCATYQGPFGDDRY